MKHKLFIIGLGKRGLVHVQLVALRQDVTLVGGYDPLIAAADYKDKIAFPMYQNLEQGLKETQPNLILIATPPKVRSTLLPSLIHVNSIKTIIIEKPLALSISEAYQIGQTCIEKNWDLFIVHQSRFCQEFIALKEAILQGRLGDLIFIKGACYGNLFNQGSHMIDLIRWLTEDEKIIWVDATGSNNREKLCALTQIPIDFTPDEDHPGHLWSSLMMRLQSGLEVLLTCGLLDAGPLPHLGPWLQRRITVVGSKGTAHAHLSASFEEYSLSTPDRNSFRTTPKNYLDSLGSFYENVLNTPERTRTERQQDINNHLYTLAALQAGLISANQHEVVKVPVQVEELISLDEALEQCNLGLISTVDWALAQHDYYLNNMLVGPRPNLLHTSNQDHIPLERHTVQLPVISVIIPMETHRGIADQALLSWTMEQQCEKKLYEVIVVFHQNQSELKNEITAKYGALARIVCIDAHNEIELCHYGATLAKGEYLLFTESHCIAEPFAVQQALNFFIIENHDGFYPRTIAIDGNAMSQLEFKLYNMSVAEFDNPSYWAKVTLHAFGIKKQVYFTVGGFAHPYNRFAYWVFGADLHRMGYSLGYAPGVGIAHLFVDGFKSLDQFIAECVSGEVQFRFAENHPYNYAAYFEKPKEWSQVQKYNPDLSKLMLRACSSCFGNSINFKNQFLSINILNAALLYFFAKPYFWSRYNLPRLFYKSRLICSRKKSEASWTHFYNYFQKTMIWYRVKYAIKEKQIVRHRKINLQKHYDLGQVHDLDLYGFHNLERHQEKEFRWSQRMSAIRVFLTPECQLIRIKLLENSRKFRPNSELYCFINEEKIEEFEFNESKSEIIFKLSKKYSAQDEGYWLILFSKPWVSKLRKCVTKNNEKRTLGFPIQEIRLECPLYDVEKGISL